MKLSSLCLAASLAFLPGLALAESTATALLRRLDPRRVSACWGKQKGFIRSALT